jgi:hypothetical protein
MTDTMTSQNIDLSSWDTLYMNLGTTRLRGRPRNGWQDEMREDGRLIGGKEWKERVYNRQEWKKLLRTARNRHILHVLTELIKELQFSHVGVIPPIIRTCPVTYH